MTQVQTHGFLFQDWVKQTFFPPFEDSYTDKWDVPSEHNSKPIVPNEFRNLPVSIKTAKFGSPISFGDAMRQFTIAEDFILIVGFWKQRGSSKNFIAVEAVNITVEVWHNLWKPISIKELQAFDVLVKDYETNYAIVRKNAKAMKSNSPFNSAMIILNPKIDSKSQRRLQCSLPFKTFWSDIAKKEPSETKKPALFGKSVPNPFFSPPRTFKRL